MSSNMAASITRVVTLTTTYCSRHFSPRICKPSTSVGTIRRLSSTNANNEASDAESVFTNDEEMEEEERIEQLRDISRLTEPQKRRMYGIPPEITKDFHRSVRYQRRVYGRLGADSGVDPRISWTGREKALELADLFQKRHPPLEEEMEKLKINQEDKAYRLQMREQKIAENMAKMDGWIAEYRKKVSQKEAEVARREEKKRKILEDAREFFGYYVDPRDAKFQEMLEEKEKQEKLAAKQQKKEKKMEKLAARLKHMATEAGTK